MVNIKKIKLKGNALEVTTDVNENGVLGHPTTPYETPVHQDFINAVMGLAVHQGLINGAIKKIKGGIENVKHEMIEDLRPTGFAITKKGDGVVITGQIKTPSGKFTTYNTPATRFEEDESTAYQYMPELLQVIEKIKLEFEEYKAGRKLGQAKQGTLDIPDATDDDETTGGNNDDENE